MKQFKRKQFWENNKCFMRFRSLLKYLNRIRNRTSLNWNDLPENW